MVAAPSLYSAVAGVVVGEDLYLYFLNTQYSHTVVGEEEERRRVKTLQSRKTGRDSYSPEVCADIVVVGGVGYLVVPSVGL